MDDYAKLFMWIGDHLQIPTISAVITSTILIIKCMSDLNKSSNEREKEIKEELKYQAKRDIEFSLHKEQLQDLRTDFNTFRVEVNNELNRLSNLIVDTLAFKKAQDKQ